MLAHKERRLYVLLEVYSKTWQENVFKSLKMAIEVMGRFYVLFSLVVVIILAREHS